MYSGIGLKTPQGSGTSGYVQRNWAVVRKTKGKVNYNTDDGELEQLNQRSNRDILHPIRRRKIEVKCAELADTLEGQGFPSEEVTKKVELYRTMLMETSNKPAISRDVRETHQIAEAQQETNANLSKAFGVSEFVEGSSLDPERHACEAEARVQTPSPDPDTMYVPETKKRKTV